jgi:hypothetical protein
LNALGDNHALEAHGECITPVIEEKSKWTGVACPSCLFTIHFVEHSVPKVAERIKEEKPLRNWFFRIILKLGAITPKEHEKW